MQNATRRRKSPWHIAFRLIATMILLGGTWPAWADDHDKDGAKHESANMVAFRGGYMHLDSDRSNALFTDARNPLGAGLNDSQNGWYVGAWLDLALSKGSWGLMDNTCILGEIGIQFNRILSQVVTNTNNIGVGTSPPAGLQVTSTAPSLQQLTMVTINIAPKSGSWKAAPSVPGLSPWASTCMSSALRRMELSISM